MHSGVDGERTLNCLLEVPWDSMTPY
jgi:hypothetical protein